MPNNYLGYTFSYSSPVIECPGGNMSYYTGSMLKLNAPVTMVESNPLGYFQVKMDTPRWINTVIFYGNYKAGYGW
jgi:hypothetical protein